MHTGSECPPGWTWYNHSCYKLQQQFVNYKGATDGCTYLGANLVSLADEAEHRFIIKTCVYVIRNVFKKDSCRSQVILTMFVIFCLCSFPSMTKRMFFLMNTTIQNFKGIELLVSCSY